MVRFGDGVGVGFEVDGGRYIVTETKGNNL
jgi:hypothetical protein